MAERLNTTDPDFETRFTTLLSSKRESAADVEEASRDIIAAVRRAGDAALVELTTRFDQFEVTPETLRIGPDEIEDAAERAPAEERAAIDLAAERIAAFHEREKPKDERWTDTLGVELGWRWRPVDAAGLYAPGGAASYPSSVLMNAIPARVAGVKRIALCAPTPYGVVNPLVLYAAKRAGVDEIYRVGGAQAIAAMAYGSQTIAPVDVVVGPGNAYVAAAKRQVFGKVGVDSVAGPSEVVIVADAENKPDWLAADLLAQAEHDQSAQSILITPDAALADAVAVSVETMLETLPRRAIAGASWRDNGAIILSRDIDEAAGLVDRLAPEHLEIAAKNPDGVANKITHAGAIFLGRLTAEAIGDYVAGANHVLPTARSARYASGLSTATFMKRSTLAKIGKQALAAIGPAAETLAAAEGLDAHALSVRLRREACADMMPPRAVSSADFVEDDG